MSLLVPGYTLQDVAVGDVDSISISRVGGGDFSVSYSFMLEDELTKERQTLTFTEVLTGGDLAEIADLVTARLPAINAWWTSQIVI